ncbi:hypothetical protein [Amycolatopsis speibonae]|uniref:Uncharacterized protein n=1 Tax=Amycolatopsis speibonae TaxID=1450224 RepID=A0ABV7NU42_9PSEU
MKPIGFWFAHLHQALASSMDKILADEALSPFEELTEVVSDPRTHGRVDTESHLTPSGREMHLHLETKVGVLERMAANLARE